MPLSVGSLNPGELSAASLDETRPYGEGVSEEEANRARQQTEMTVAAAKPRGTRDLDIGGQFGPHNPGEMQWPGEELQQEPAPPPSQSPGGLGGALRSIPNTSGGVGLGDLAGYIVARVGHGLGSMGEGMEQIGKEAGKQSPVRPEGSRSYPSIGNAAEGFMKVAGGAAEATVALPFMAIADTAREAIVESDPDLASARDEVLKMMGGVANDPVARSEANGKVIGITRDLMLKGATDPESGLDTGQRMSAFILGAGLAASQFSEIGGPSAIRWLSQRTPTILAALRPQQAQAAPSVVGQISQNAQTAGALGGQAQAAATTGANVGDVLVKAQQKSLEDAKRLVQKLTGGEKELYRERDLESLDSAIAAIEAAGQKASLPVPPGLLNDLHFLRTQVYDAVFTNAGNKMLVKEGVKLANAEQSAASKIANAADRDVRNAARRATTAQTNIEEAVSRFGRAKEAAQQVAVGKRAGEIQTAAKQVAGAEQGVKKAVQQGSRDAEQISRTTGDEITRIAEDGEQIKAGFASIADDLAAKAAKHAENVRASAGKTRTTVRIKGSTPDSPVEIGYVNPDDAEVLDRLHIHTGKFENQTTVSELANVAKNRPEVMIDIEEKMRASTLQQAHDDALAELASKTGIDKDELLKDFPQRLELTRMVYLGNATTDALARDVNIASKALRDGEITAEKYAEVEGRFLDFLSGFLPFRSEIGRSLSHMRAQVKDLPLDVVTATRQVKVSQKRLDKANVVVEEKSKVAADALAYAAEQSPKIDSLTAKSQEAAKQVEALLQEQARAVTGEALTAATAKLNAAKKQLQALLTDRATIENATSKRVQNAKASMEDALSRADEARLEYDNKVQIAADAAQKFHAATLTTAARKAMTPEQIRVLADMDPLNVGGILAFLRDATEVQPLGEKVTGYLLNSMYGAVQSLAQNDVTNLIHSATRAGPIQAVAENVTGPIVNRIVGETVMKRGEGIPGLVSMVMATPDAARFHLNKFVQGEDIPRSIQYGLSGKLGAGGAFDIPARPMVRGPLGIVVEGALRKLSGGDGFQRIMDGAAEQTRLAFLKGGAQEVARQRAMPTPEYIRRAAKVAGETTFSQSAITGSNTAKLMAPLDFSFKGFSPLRVLIPAAKFSINLAKAGAGFTPYGLARGTVKAFQAKGLEQGSAEKIDLARSAARDLATGVLSLPTIMWAASLQAQGLITGARPTDPREAQQWDADEKSEYSANLGGKWFPLGWAGPAAMPFILTVALSELDDDRVAGEKGARVAGGLARFYLDNPLFSATYHLMETVNTAVTYGAKAAAEKFVANNMARRLVPDEAFARSFTPFFDDTKRDPQGSDRGLDLEGILERVWAGLPFASRNAPPMIDPSTGEAVKNPQSNDAMAWLNRDTSPVPSSVAKVFAETGVLLDAPEDIIGTVQLTPEEYTALSVNTGRKVAQATAEIQASDLWKNETDNMVRQAILQQARNDARKDARAQAARDGVKAAKDDETALRGALMARAQLSAADTVYALEDLAARGLLSTKVRQQLDESRRRTPTDEQPTVEEQLRVAPLVHQFRAIPPYTRGTPAEWAKRPALEAKRRLYVSGSVNPERAALEFERNLPKADRDILNLEANPRRSQFVDRNPSVRQYVTMRTPE